MEWSSPLPSLPAEESLPVLLGRLSLPAVKGTEQRVVQGASALKDNTSQVPRYCKCR